jgi:hypothetical protein
VAVEQRADDPSGEDAGERLVHGLRPPCAHRLVAIQRLQRRRPRSFAGPQPKHAWWGAKRSWRLFSAGSPRSMAGSCGPPWERGRSWWLSRATRAVPRERRGWRPVDPTSLARGPSGRALPSPQPCRKHRGNARRLQGLRSGHSL